jgi:hypothetical protein
MPSKLNPNKFFISTRSCRMGRASDITELRHVRTSADKRAAEEIANRQKCEDFERCGSPRQLFAVQS